MIHRTVMLYTSLYKYIFYDDGVYVQSTVEMCVLYEHVQTNEYVHEI